ncbi:head-tail connector protein [Albimonas sp. CAU 1670]|uniref:head-tail connector protein n=1 Tax=Albimonas sp. CAU 1670 TaxID=3032599 RepID=UPI0023DAB3B2|nr:head-tail connector protein [Albimonas sp. CAU 1670]MDF2232954.1 head-tail connector protein [Albimonas sp. CAU 1670]
MLSELEPAPWAPIPLAELAAHLRLPEGLEEQERGALELYARAAGAAVEGMTGKALISRKFTWTVTRWRDAFSAPLPIAPVSWIDAVTMLDAEGGWQAADPSTYVLVPSAHRPRIEGARGRALPAVPVGGRIEVELTAGFGEDWNAIPADLRQAVMLLAAQYYEQRQVTADPVREAPYGVEALVARHREIRL